VTPRWLFEEMGGFDEGNFAVAYNDADYGYRLVKAGWRNVYCADAELFHHEGKSRGFSDNPREVSAYRRCYRTWEDRWYNPNLSLRNERFEPAPIRLPLRSRGPIKLAVISHNLNFEGAPLTLQDLVIGLVRAGAAEVTVFAPCDGPLRAGYEKAGIPIRLIGDPQAGVADPSVYLGACEAIGRAFHEVDTEVVVANTLSTFWAITAAQSVGLPAIWCQHESEPWQTYYDYLAQPLRGYAYSAFAQAYRVTYVAEATRRTWQAVETRGNFQVIRHGIHPERLSAEISLWSRAMARTQLKIDEDDLVLVLVGTVCRRKNQRDLINAFAGLPPEIQKRLRLFVVGAFGERAYAGDLQELASELPPDIALRVTITGPTNGTSIYYSAADIAVCTSLIESAPRVIVEAMAFGLPILTTPVFGIPELVREGVNAQFYQPGDVKTLAKLIETLVKNEALRLKLAGNSREVLNSLPGYSEMLEDYTSLIRQAVLVGGPRAAVRC
jgi:glycosyltransferase involved in cell wall biosynthesis